MKSRRTLLMACTLSLILLLGFAASASASGRTSVGAFVGSKYEGGAADVGLELEYRFDNGFAIVAAGGVTLLKGEAEATAEPAISIGLYNAALGARYYFLLGQFNPFIGINGTALIASAMGITVTVPGVQATAGLEMMLNRIRIAGEVGYGTVFLEEKLQPGALVYGASLGYCF